MIADINSLYCKSFSTQLSPFYTHINVFYFNKAPKNLPRAQTDSARGTIMFYALVYSILLCTCLFHIMNPIMLSLAEAGPMS